MKTPFLGLRTVAYFVPDINEGKKWYTDFFETQPYFDEPFYVGFNIGGYELGLQPVEDIKYGDNVVTYWGVEDIDTEYKNCLAKGATPHHEPQDVGDGIKVASVSDPWGNVIGLIYNPHFKL